MIIVVILGKCVQAAASLRGGGSSLPGLIIEKIKPSFLKDSLGKLPNGVVVISGTNGKTTTTKMVVELLKSQGLKVLTNPSGSNFTRGVVSALLKQMSWSGKLDADIAVIELDEAHAVHFVKAVAPNYSLLLNVMRDQLDRFGEIDTTAKMLEKVAAATTDAVVLNREDKRISNLSSKVKNAKVAYFGLGTDAREHFPTDDELHAKQISAQENQVAATTLESFKDHTATFNFNDNKKQAELKLEGIYNVFNAAAALALVKEVMKDNLDETKLFDALASVNPAFGRGEKVEINGTSLEIVLVKNPSGFRLSLKSFDSKNVDTMICINDNYADGRDMSWLWDVDFSSLQTEGVAMVSGIRAYDMALRLQYDEVPVQKVNDSLASALKQFIKTNPGKPKRIFCTYTYMLALRRELGKTIKMESMHE